MTNILYRCIQLLPPSGYMTPLVQLKVRNDNGTDLTV